MNPISSSTVLANTSKLGVATGVDFLWKQKEEYRGMHQSIQEEWAWVEAKIRRNYSSLCFQVSMGLLISLKTSFPWEYIKLKKRGGNLLGFT